MGTSTLTNPNPLYPAGNFNITYTAIVNGSPVSYSKNLVVYAPPTGNFSYVIPPSHCAPMTVNFTGSGGSPGSTITWAFGDLSSLGSGASISHVYSFSGNFVPVMVVQDAVTGCTAVANSPGTIHVSSPPNVVINSSNGYHGCSPPFVTNITGTNSSSGSPITGGGLTYNWILNGGTPGSSSAGTPGSVSFGQGTNFVSLTVTDNNQCSNTGTVPIVVSNPSLVVTTQGTFCLNGAVSATVLTTESSTSWNIPGVTGATVFPDTANLPHVIDSVWIFNTPGLQIFTVTVNSGGNCPPVVQNVSVFIEQVIPSYSATPPSFGCGPNMAATFINLSTSNTSNPKVFTWSASWVPSAYWGVTPQQTITTNVGTNVTFNLSYNSPNPYYIYQYYFVPAIGLKVKSTSVAGCTASINFAEFDTIGRPTAFFTTSKREGCVPLSVTIRDSSFHTLNNAITGYTVCNGASPPLCVSGYTNIFPVTFNYTSTGTYYPYQIIKTAMGCVDTSFVDTITVVNPPTITATVVPSTSVCVGQTVQVNMSANSTTVPSSSSIQHWHVDSDDGYYFGCVNNKSPSYPFIHPGLQTFTVSAYQNSCKGSAVLTQSVLVKGPVGKFIFETTCTGNKKSVNFYSYLQEAQSATLSFGDNFSVTIPGNPAGNASHTVLAHIYPATGNYTATLVTTNLLTGCSSFTYTQVIKIRDPKARILFNGMPIPALPNPLACVMDPYNFTGTLSTDAAIECEIGYNWLFMTPTYTVGPDNTYLPFRFKPPPGAHLFDDIALDTFRVATTYTICLTVKDENGCKDTETKIFRISSAVPDFSFNPNPACYSTGFVQVVNSTQANQVFPDTIKTYKWNFGDGSPVLTSTNALNNPTHSYPFILPPSQTFTVKCVAINQIGCKDSLEKTIQVNNPLANFFVSNSYPCLPKGQSTSVLFSATSGYATYSVSYGDTPTPVWTTSGNYTNVPHTYNTPGVYIATLNVTDNVGCKTSDQKTVTVIGQPTAGILFVDGKSKFCVPGTPTMVSNSTVNVTPITNYMWTVGGVTQPPPGDDTLKNIFSVGVYVVSLQVSVGNALLCPHTASALVKVYDPHATAVVDKKKFCLGDEIKVYITDSNSVYNWKWFFGDNVKQDSIYAGSIIANMNPTLTYQYNTFPTTGDDGKTTLNLLYYSAEFACLKVSPIPIQVIKINADFKTVNDVYAHCLDGVDNFTSTTPNPIGLTYQYSWDFGNSHVSSNSDPLYTYPLPGVYTVSLSVTDVDYNCVGTSVKNITVFPLPTASITVDDRACPETPFNIHGGGTPGTPGALTATLFPAPKGGPLTLDANNAFSITTMAASSTTFALNVTDKNGCVNKTVFDSIYIQQPAPSVLWDTTVIIGQPIPLNAYVGNGFTYTWTPVTTYLNCDSCTFFNPVSTTTMNMTYSVTVEDFMHCSKVPSIYKVYIEPKASIDVPTAFTPNGDGTNDMIFVDGWGIRKLLYFRIYNRWGQLVFESNDIKVGWDGRYSGIPQNTETYVYQASVETYVHEVPVLSKSGSFKLLR